MTRILLFIAFALTLSSCTAQVSKFPGFVEVSNSPDAASFYVDPKSIRQDEDGDIEFKLLETLPTGYAIQDAAVSPDNNFSSAQGISYSDDGSVLGNFSGIQVDLKTDPAKGPLAVAHFVRDEVNKLKSFNGEFQNSKALQALYGNYRPDIDGSVRKNVHMPNDGAVSPECTAKVVLSQEFTTVEGKARFLLIATKPENYDCHACSPLISFAVYKQSETGWALKDACDNSELPGQYGEAPKSSWVQMGTNKWGLVCSGTGGNQGFFTEYLSAFEIVNNGFKEVLGDSIDYNDQQEPPDLSVEFQKSAKPNWDALVKASYKNPSPRIQADKYVFADGVYSLAGKSSIHETLAKPKDVEHATVEEEQTTPAPKATTLKSNEVSAPRGRSKKEQTSRKPTSSDPLDPSLFVDH